jgi:hypothetical protein
MGFNSAFKGLKEQDVIHKTLTEIIIEQSVNNDLVVQQVIYIILNEILTDS